MKVLHITPSLSLCELRTEDAAEIFRAIEPRGEMVSDGVFRDLEVWSLKRRLAL